MHNFLQKKAKEKKENKKSKNLYTPRGARRPAIPITLLSVLPSDGFHHSRRVREHRICFSAAATSGGQSPSHLPASRGRGKGRDPAGAAMLRAILGATACAEREPPAGREREREPSLEPPRPLEALLTGNLR